MIVKAIYKDNNFNYFRDLETKQKRFYGDIFECSDELAKERIKKGYVAEATEEEQKAYVDSIDTFDEEDLKEDKQKSKGKKNNKKQEEVKPNDNSTSKGDNGNTESTNNDENKISGDDDESTKVKALEECTLEELQQITVDENILATTAATKEQLIELINKTREENSAKTSENGGE